MVIAASPQELSNARDPEPITVTLTEINEELIAWLSKHPEYLHKLDPRKFEELVAEILRDQGHTVELTPQTKDQGRDIIAGMRTPLGEMLVIVECKRYAAHRKVGLSVVERFLHTIRERDRANMGMVVTTTRFSPDAIKVADEYRHQLKLKDQDALCAMANNYGKWKKHGDSEIWIPAY